jgi:hypothetical protein
MSKATAKSRRTTASRKSIIDTEAIASKSPASGKKAAVSKKPARAKQVPKGTAAARRRVTTKEASKRDAVTRKPAEAVEVHKQRSWRVAFFLSLFLGPFGVDRFYIGRTRSAIVKLATLSCFGVWWLTDFILIASDWRKDADGQPLKH